MGKMMGMTAEEVAPPRPDLSGIRSGLVIDGRWLDLILLAEKTWEMRSQRTRKREWIGLIRAGSKTVVGICRVVGEHGPLSLDQMKATYEKHCIPREEIQAAYERGWRWAWKLEEVYKLRKLIPYEHRNGAQRWVTFDDHVRALLKEVEVQGVTGPSSP
jgi:hypothetical protein